VLEAGTVRSR